MSYIIIGRNFIIVIMLSCQDFIIYVFFLLDFYCTGFCWFFFVGWVLLTISNTYFVNKHCVILVFKIFIFFQNFKIFSFTKPAQRVVKWGRDIKGAMEWIIHPSLVPMPFLFLSLQSKPIVISVLNHSQLIPVTTQIPSRPILFP